MCVRADATSSMATSGAALILAEHAPCGKLLPHTLSTIAAARKLLVGQVVALVAGSPDTHGSLENAAHKLSTAHGVDEVCPQRARPHTSSATMHVVHVTRFDSGNGNPKLHVHLHRMCMMMILTYT